MSQKDKTSPCTETKSYAFQNAKRCGAKSRQNNGNPCRAPAAPGKSRCRMHGGAHGSGAQPGNTNALKHGFYTALAKRIRRDIRQVQVNLKISIK